MDAVLRYVVDAYRPKWAQRWVRGCLIGTALGIVLHRVVYGAWPL